MDIHKRTASLLFDKPIEEVTKTERQIAKSANFGLQYGASVEGFQRYANSYGIALTMEEARRIREAWFSGYRDIAAHHSRVRSQKPSTVTTIAGRVLHTKTVQNALNLPIQGSGADLLNRATAIIQEKLKGFDAAIVAFVHDELVIEVRAEQAEQVAEVVQTGMREAGREFYPDDADLIRCEVQIGQSWGKGEVYTPEAEVDMDAVNGLAETLESTPAAVDENGRLTRAFFDDLTRGFMAENGAVWLKPLKAALSKTFSNMAIEATNSEDAERQCSSAFPADCTLERGLKALAVEEGWERSSVTVERRGPDRGGGATWLMVYHEDELDAYQVEADYAEAMDITPADKVEVTHYPWTEADLRDIADLLTVVDFKHRARDGTGGQKGTDTSEGKCHD
jgi:hypothetical protein